MKISIVILFSMMVILPSLLKGQVLDGIYRCESCEDSLVSVHVSGKTIAVSLPNHDAFGTYSLFVGLFKVKNNDINLQMNDISKFSSIETSANVNENEIKVTFLDYLRRPISQTQVVVMKNENTSFNLVTNEAGEIVLTSEEHFSSKGVLEERITVKIQSVGYITQQSFEPKLGTHHQVISSLPIFFAFTEMSRKRITLRTISDERIKVCLKNTDVNYVFLKTDRAASVFSDCLGKN